MAIIKYKGTDGEFKPLNNVLIKGIEVVQTTGTSEIKVMSQKAVTETTSGISDTLTAHTADENVHLTQLEKRDIDAIADNIATISGITTNDVANWDSAYTDSHTHSNKQTLDEITATSTAINSLSGSVGSMAFENVNSYSSATEVNAALADKSNTGHTHTSVDVTAMTSYSTAGNPAMISTGDTLNQAIGKLECRLGSIMKFQTLSQAEYDVLVDAGTVDETTLYVIIN